MSYIRLIYQFLLFLLCSLFSSNLLAQDISSIYNHSKDSIVLIVAYDKNKTPLGMGTGFYFREKLVATNYHVVEGASSFLVKNIGIGKQFNASIVRSYSEKLDIALIEVEEKYWFEDSQLYDFNEIEEFDNGNLWLEEGLEHH